MKSDRIKAIFADYQNAFNRLTDALKNNPDNDIVIDGTIQRFEFTFELGWKLMKSFLEYQGIECNSPRNSIKEAFSYGLISEGDERIDMLEDRNRIAHIYDEKAAFAIYKKIKDSPFIRFNEFLLKIQNEIQGI